MIRTNIQFNMHLFMIVISMVLSLVIIFPIVVYSANSMPAPDDYSNAYVNFMEAERGEISSYVIPAWHKMIYIYENAGGSFYSSYVTFLISPLSAW